VYRDSNGYSQIILADPTVIIESGHLAALKT
jgi:hypothetical protein